MDPIAALEHGIRFGYVLLISSRCRDRHKTRASRSIVSTLMKVRFATTLVDRVGT